MLTRSFSQTSLILTALVVAGFATSRPATAVSFRYSITDLGTLGGPSSFPYGINDLRQVVGSANTDRVNNYGSFTSHPFLWDRINGMQDISTVLNGVSDINNRGELAGTVDTGKTDIIQGHIYHAAIYSKGKIQDLGALNGLGSFPNAINDLGQVVGNSEVNVYTFHAFLYNNGKMQDLGTLGDGNSSFSSAQDINNLGQVVGYSSSDISQFRAFLYSDGKMQDLGTLGSDESIASSINNLGQIVGYSPKIYLGGNRAFLYSDGRMQDLGTLGGDESIAEDINDLGQVVGYSNLTPQSANSHAFLWDSAKGMQDLNSLIPTNSRWKLEYANNINKHGQIVGSGTINGQTHAFLLAPRPIPEPALMLGTMAFGAFLIQRRCANGAS